MSLIPRRRSTVDNTRPAPDPFGLRDREYTPTPEERAAAALQLDVAAQLVQQDGERAVARSAAMREGMPLGHTYGTPDRPIGGE
jgi:hypothetical protein